MNITRCFFSYDVMLMWFWTVLTAMNFKVQYCISCLYRMKFSAFYDLFRILSAFYWMWFYWILFSKSFKAWGNKILFMKWSLTDGIIATEIKQPKKIMRNEFFLNIKYFYTVKRKENKCINEVNLQCFANLWIKAWKIDKHYSMLLSDIHKHEFLLDC